MAEALEHAHVAGFHDVFDLRRGAEGQELTCCHSVDLSSDAVPLEKRIDHILVRNFDGLWPATGNPPVYVEVVGNSPPTSPAGSR